MEVRSGESKFPPAARFFVYAGRMHKYSIGQTVHYFGEAGTHNVSGGYEIVRVLPESSSGDLQYRLKRRADGQERVAGEHQLSRVGEPRPA